MAQIDVLPRSRIVKVEFEFVLPVSATHEQIEEWVRFELMQDGSCGNDNPLLDHGCESIGDPILTDTERHLHFEVESVSLSPEDPPNCTARWITRRWRSPEPYQGPTEFEQMEETRRQSAPRVSHTPEDQQNS